MTLRIYKFQLSVVDRQTVMMPAGAKLLDVQMQGDSPCIWALLNDQTEYEPRHFAIYGTGNPVPDDPGVYVATFQMHGGALVWHVFETQQP